jgi:hypothetical protein
MRDGMEALYDHVPRRVGFRQVRAAVVQKTERGGAASRVRCLPRYTGRTGSASASEVGAAIIELSLSRLLITVSALQRQGLSIKSPVADPRANPRSADTSSPAT